MDCFCCEPDYLELSDPENENLVITILSGSTVGDTTTLTNGKLARNSDGSYTYKPNPGWPAANTSADEVISYKVTDPGALNSNNATITITVSNPPANAAPIAGDDLYNESKVHLEELLCQDFLQFENESMI